MKLFSYITKYTRLSISLLVLTILAILYITLTPFYLKHTSAPDQPAHSYPYEQAFLTDYDAIRERFLTHQTAIDWPNISFHTTEIDATDNLAIDTLFLPATEEKENLILITTGVHGIESYIGSTMLEVFISEILPTLDQSHTGIAMVTNVNPYGAKYGRRYNENNVDLNRNFIFDWESFDPSINKDYPQVVSFLEPQTAIGNMALHELGFLGGLAKEALTNGVATITNALLGGQYEYPNGVYYGGTEDEASTRYLKQVFHDTLHAGYENIIYIDIHSGYGPRYDMTIFNSNYDPMTEAEASKAYGYDTVLAHDSDNFYATTGDTTEYFYRLAEQVNPSVQLYATCFEFGTIGDTLIDSILSMKYTIDENRNYWFPTHSTLTDTIIQQRYMELFLPSEPAWREKAIQDFIQATTGVLKTKLID